MSRLVVATKNRGKTAEIRSMAADLDLQIASLSELDEEIEIVEDADSFAGNAVKKAKTVARICGCPALADDSGLEVDALNGRPGVHSARYGGRDLSDADRNARLVAELSGVALEDRTARFQCAMAYAAPGREPELFFGTLEGRIAAEPKGDHGFGYDPVFIPRGYDQTIAQMGPEIKNRISHRAKALTAFFEWLKTRK